MHLEPLAGRGRPGGGLLGMRLHCSSLLGCTSVLLGKMPSYALDEFRIQAPLRRSLLTLCQDFVKLFSRGLPQVLEQSVKAGPLLGDGFFRELGDEVRLRGLTGQGIHNVLIQGRLLPLGQRLPLTMERCW